MASSPILVGPPTPVAKNPTTEESDRGDDWHAPDRGDHDPVRTIEPSSHSLPKSMDANQPQDSSLSETILKLVADHQSQLRANNEQWAARMDDQKAEDQERERRWEARLVAQREEYQTRELNQREEYRVRELAVREEYRTQEHRMEGMLTALREENKEKERLTEEHHTAMLAFYHEKETRLDQEIAMLRERERWLEGQLKDRWNPPAAYLAAPPRDNHLPAQNHDDRDTSQKNVVDPTSSADNGLGLTAVLPPTDSSPTHPDEGDFGVSLPPQLARTPGMHGAVPF
ncbi:hypothetical protein BS47DRAFT_151945 [Hydnum rufescens UP504]|uniref:Uncharacterized protein n=1 Tax=Hydnum rufescens UP504 TaxID=1448309 RepID=A0A9P6AP14_9AGAM|nr:hypothetical protein BS47DRAFT_151945 [Hydnum rufescens UP504]